MEKQSKIEKKKCVVKIFAVAFAIEWKTEKQTAGTFSISFGPEPRSEHETGRSFLYVQTSERIRVKLLLHHEKAPPPSGPDVQGTSSWECFGNIRLEV